MLQHLPLPPAPTPWTPLTFSDTPDTVAVQRHAGRVRGRLRRPGYMAESESAKRFHLWFIVVQRWLLALQPDKISHEMKKMSNVQIQAAAQCKVSHVTVETGFLVDLDTLHSLLQHTWKNEEFLFENLTPMVWQRCVFRLHCRCRPAHAM